MTATTKVQEEYLPVDKAALFLGMKHETLYKMALERRIPSYKVGKLRRFKMSDLVSFMESQRVEARKSR